MIAAGRRFLPVTPAVANRGKAIVPAPIDPSKSDATTATVDGVIQLDNPDEETKAAAIPAPGSITSLRVPTPAPKELIALSEEEEEERRRQEDPAAELGADFLQEMKEIFSLFDFENDGNISTNDLGTVIRGLGKNLTERQINKIINHYDQSGSGKFDFATFHTIMKENRPMRGPPTFEEVLDHFKVFDIHGDGILTGEDFVHLLRQRGEPLSQADVDNLLLEITIDGDKQVNIQDFVTHMFQTSRLDDE